MEVIMGSEVFYHTAAGKTAREAFNNAKQEAHYDHGHSGYSGSIAEKNNYVIIECPDGVSPAQYADTLIEEADARIDDKWGPAGCIKVKEGHYLFFGWASS